MTVAGSMAHQPAVLSGGWKELILPETRMMDRETQSVGLMRHIDGARQTIIGSLGVRRQGLLSSEAG